MNRWGSRGLEPATVLLWLALSLAWACGGEASDDKVVPCAEPGTMCGAGCTCMEMPAGSPYVGWCKCTDILEPDIAAEDESGEAYTETSTEVEEDPGTPCIPAAERRCVGDAVYHYDSCETRGELIEECANGCEEGACKDCVPQCDGRQCGDDGCLGTCGICPDASCDGLTWTSAKSCVSGNCSGGGDTLLCDDGHDCTTDGCSTGAGCTHEVKAGFCLIEGMCFAEGQPSPTTPCRLCTPKQSQDAWTDAASGTPCEPAACSGLSWKLARTCASGACTGGGGTVSCDDGKACTSDACSAADGCSSQLQPGRCLIGGTCRTGGDLNPSNACQACVPAQSASAWSALDEGTVCQTASCSGSTWSAARTCMSGSCSGGGNSLSCDDGLTCTIDACTTSGCSHEVQPGKCLIDGVCYSDGALQPGNGCMACRSSTTTAGWTPVVDGTVCGTSLSCTAGRCAPPMVSVKGGTFWMGANSNGQQCPTNALDSEGLDQEFPCHQRTVRAFQIDKYEVTVAAYKACVDAGGCGAPSMSSSGCNWGVAGKEQYPINCIVWYQADTYCNWAGKRLCSEAEWERAARGTDGRLFPWGNTAATCTQAVMYGNGDEGCGTGATWAVGSKPAGAGPYGTLDMMGNVGEFVADDWHADYRGAPPDESPWIDSPRSNYRVMRGGDYRNFKNFERASYRDEVNRLDNLATRGTRCCQ